MFCEDEETGLWLRVRPDWIHEVAGRSDRSRRENLRSKAARIRRAVQRKNAYHVQDAMYSDVIQKATGKPVLAFLFGGVDTNTPYLSACYELDDDSKETGRIQYRRGIAEFASARPKTNGRIRRRAPTLSRAMRSKHRSKSWTSAQ